MEPSIHCQWMRLVQGSRFLAATPAEGSPRPSFPHPFSGPLRALGKGKGRFSHEDTKSDEGALFPERLGDRRRVAREARQSHHATTRPEHPAV